MFGHKELLSLLQEQYTHKQISEQDIDLIENAFSTENVKSLLLNILSNSELLEQVASRSYLHALGFYKIVLADTKKDISSSLPKVQARLHIWHPDNQSVTITEALHEHSFNFVSKVLTGRLENQKFGVENLTDDETVLLSKLLKMIPLLSHEELSVFEQNFERILVNHLNDIGSMQKKEGLLSLECSNFTEDQLRSLSDLYGYYVSNRISGERKSYKHVLEKYIKLKALEVVKLQGGDTYFHHYTNPHRLSYDGSEINSTILVTTNVPENAKGGSFQRPTFEQTGSKDYDKVAFNAETLKKTLQEYLVYLER